MHWEQNNNDNNNNLTTSCCNNDIKRPDHSCLVMNKLETLTACLILLILAIGQEMLFENCLFPWGHPGLHQVTVPWSHLSSHVKRHLNRFSHFSTADGCVQQTGIHTEPRTSVAIGRIFPLSLHSVHVMLSVLRTRTTYGNRSFAVSGPVVWNSLPVALRSSDVMEETFRRQLKTFLFNFLDN